jgi:hypothetical protein
MAGKRLGPIHVVNDGHQRDVRNLYRRFWLLLAALGAGICGGGCGGPTLPEQFEVSGRVSVAGKELSSGTVSLRPVGKVGDQPTGRIDQDGTFRVFTARRPGAPAGKYRVVVMATETAAAKPGSASPGMPVLAVPERYTRPETTPLEIELPRDSGEKDWVLK